MTAQHLTMPGTTELAPPRARERNQLLAALSGLGITLVVLGHSEAAGVATLADPSSRPLEARVMRELVAWLQTFHMPLFFALSGFLLFQATLRGGSREYMPGALLRAKARRLLAPYVVISSLAYLPKVWLSAHAQRPVGFSARDYLLGLALPWNNPIIFFWYLPTLFAMFALAPWILAPRSGRAREVALLLIGACLSVATPHENFTGVGAFLNIGGVAHNFVFFALGFVAAKRDGLSWFYSSRPAAIAALLLSFGLFAFERDSPVSVFAMAIGGLGVAGLIAASPLQRGLARLGEYAFQIYLFSWFPQTFMKLVAAKLPALGFSLATALSLLLGVFAPIALASLLYPLLPQALRFVFGADEHPKLQSDTMPND